MTVFRDFTPGWPLLYLPSAVPLLKETVSASFYLYFFSHKTDPPPGPSSTTEFFEIVYDFPDIYAVFEKLPAVFKGTHARDFHSLFLNFSLHISVTNRYKMQSS